MAGRVFRVGAVSVVLVAALVAGLLSLVVPRVLAAPQSLSGLSASATVKANRWDVWFGQMTPSAICRFVAGCTSAATDADGFVMTFSRDVPGIGLVSQDVRAVVTRKQRPRLQRMNLTAVDTGNGSFTGTVEVRLAADGKRKTTLTVEVVSATGTGLVAAVMMPLMEQNLQPGLTSSVAALNRERAAAAGAVRVAARPRARGAVVRALVTADTVTVTPPTATGRVRVLVGSRVVCSAKVARSSGRCRFRTTKARPKVRAVVTGWWDNGFQVWNSGTKKVSR